MIRDALISLVEAALAAAQAAGDLPEFAAPEVELAGDPELASVEHRELRASVIRIAESVVDEMH